jgi:hypothetical protein
LFQLEFLRKRQAINATRQSLAAGSDTEASLRRQAQRDNAQLRVRITELLKELEETRAERQRRGLPPDNVTRLQTKLIAQHNEQNRALQVTGADHHLRSDCVNKRGLIRVIVHLKMNITLLKMRFAMNENTTTEMGTNFLFQYFCSESSSLL